MLRLLALLVSLAAVTDGSCRPEVIKLGVGTVMATSQDKYYQPGDIFAGNCSALPSRRYVGWCPSPHDTRPKIQINLPRTTAVHGILFQTTLDSCVSSDHVMGMEAFMETFDLQYVLPGDNLRTLMTYSEDLLALDGTSTEKTLRFDPPLVTPILTLTPKSYNLYPCFRFAILGCEADSLCSPGFCQNGGTCAGKDFCTCKSGFVGNNCNMTVQDIEQQDYSFMEIKDNKLITPYAEFDVVGDVTISQDRRRSGHGHDHGHSCNFHGDHDHHSYCQYSHSNHGHHGNDHHDNGHHDNDNHCMHGLTNQHHGFTTSMNVHYGHNHQGHHYLYSNGGNLHGHNGCSLSYNTITNILEFIVSTLTHKWQVNVNIDLSLLTTHNIATSWHPQTGAHVHVNNQHVGSCGHSQPHSQNHNNNVPLRIGNGHVTTNANVNVNAQMNMSVSGLNMYPIPANVLVTAGMQGPYTPAPPTSMPQPVTATTTHQPVTTTAPPVTATTTHAPLPTTTFDHRPVCYNYTELSVGASKNHMRCQTGEVCALFQDKTMKYTAKCLEKSLCEAGKRMAAGSCWECCDTYLCNDQCSASASGPCMDKSQCAVMLATGYDVCSDAKMAVDICSKTCKIC